MGLPIDFTKRPYRMKSLDYDTNLFSGWYEFGVHADGCVDIACLDGDVITHVPKDAAARLLKARDQFIAAVERELCVVPGVGLEPTIP